MKLTKTPFFFSKLINLSFPKLLYSPKFEISIF